MKKGTAKTRLIIAAAVLLAAAAAAGWLLLRKPPEQPAAGAASVFLDGEAWNGQTTAGGSDGLRVYVTLDGAPLIDLPFGEEHVLRILQASGDENTVRLTGNAVYMQEANCEGQDCVNMGEVTRDNLETRVMGGFIICLPHRISVEVREE